ncbi:hypothetical protein EV589_1846 [Mycobacterium sp. BK558]|uniref:Secreted protein n=1 Tax=Mycolicibacterium chlorophenolicum TaxID=37916 RepID=A0A0J6VAK5_9MYCO|nr:hypothetical protein [Mycolicibacterium chlorophenolicum]KMO67249.1 hypothetical protein MCHLDSM_06498 [Mycolicibacterium chlorophenolicum]MBI5338169.1 hypothetical protein [Mycolicibacterium rufum]RZT26094.1 hypothetical protein EV589_1846 [Mycobacterium sp. BK558]
MSARRSALAAATLVAAACVCPGATATAAPPDWSGRYTVITFASNKLGTSIAARQPEPDFRAQYTFSTSCAGTCVATANDGPAPSNPTIPQPSRYTWDGKQWVFNYNWQWECFRGDDVPREYVPARSLVFYAPTLDGSMYGSWRTEILDGICKGTVVMPVAAYPA